MRQPWMKWEVDQFGLDEVDRKNLLTIIAVAASVSEDRDSIEEMIEPYLIQNGFLNRTPRGRTLTDAAYPRFGFQLAAEYDIKQTA